MCRLQQGHTRAPSQTRLRRAGIVTAHGQRLGLIHHPLRHRLAQLRRRRRAFGRQAGEHFFAERTHRRGGVPGAADGLVLHGVLAAGPHFPRQLDLHLIAERITISHLGDGAPRESIRDFLQSFLALIQPASRGEFRLARDRARAPETHDVRQLRVG